MYSSKIIYEKKFPKITREEYDQRIEDTYSELPPFRHQDSQTFVKNLLESVVRIIIPDRMENSGFFISMAKQVAEHNEIDTVCCNSVVEDRGVYQLNMFDDISNQLRSRAIQETMLSIKAKYGKNAILKGVNYDPAATGRERNLQIGGHKSNG